MERNWWRIVGEIIALIVIIILLALSFKNCSGNKEMEEKVKGLESENIDLERAFNDQSNDLKNAQDSISIYKGMYNKCAGILTPEEELNLLKKENAELKARKPIVIFKKAKASQPAPAPISQYKPDVSESKFESNFAPSPQVTTTVTNPSENNLVTTKYKGVMEGDYGTTIDDNSGRIIYFLKNSFIKNNNNNAEAPRLNGVTGEKFNYNAETGYWYYIDGQTMTVSEINSWDYAKEWNVYIGKTDYGVGSYDTYLPHQALKPLINRVRGKEWGEISDDDLFKMRKLNSSIWTPKSEGTLIPYRLNSTSGRAYGKEDKQLYQGWNFRTKIVAIEKTTTFGFQNQKELFILIDETAFPVILTVRKINIPVRAGISEHNLWS